jgi:hypothetical protein
LPDQYYSEINTSFCVLMAELWDEKGNSEVKPTISGQAMARPVIGTTVAHASQLLDSNGESGTWFVLDDWSVRIHGRYR